LFVTAERDLANAKYNYQLAFIDLKRATGVLLKTILAQESIGEITIPSD
jgi:outer membrane protein TolC